MKAGRCPEKGCGGTLEATIKLWLTHGPKGWEIASALMDDPEIAVYCSNDHGDGCGGWGDTPKVTEIVDDAAIAAREFLDQLISPADQP